MNKNVIVFIVVFILFLSACMNLSKGDNKNNTDNEYSGTTTFISDNQQEETSSSLSVVTNQSSDTITNDLFSFDDDKKYIICNRWNENPCILELDCTSDFPVLTANSKNITLDHYEEVKLFCMTNQGFPIYVANDENNSFLVINEKKYPLETCPSDILPYMDSAILIYDNDENCTSYICKLDLSTGNEKLIISDLAFERTRDAVRTNSSKIVYKGSGLENDEWNLYDGLTDKTTTFVSKGACSGFKDASTLIFCESIDLPVKNKIKFSQFDLDTGKSKYFCSFMLNDTPAPNNIFILIDENYVIMESSGNDFFGGVPKSYFINMNTGKFVKTDYVFPDNYIVLTDIS